MSGSRKRHDVCSAVVSHLPFDARVWREMRTLAQAGYDVKLIGCCYDIAVAHEHCVDGVDVIEVPFGPRDARRPNVLRARALLRLSIEVLRTRARIYHAHNIHTVPAAAVAARLRGAKLVYDAHELYGETEDGRSWLHRAAARLGSAIERAVVRRSAAVITTNPARAGVLQDRHGRDAIDVLANVPPPCDEVVPLDPGYPQDRKILLYQGGIYARERAFKETIEALPMLEDFDLVVIGFGRDGDIALLRSWATDAGVSDRVHVLPPRPFGELVSTAAAANVGLVPIKATNVNNLLGDTNKLFEYLMAGLPVAASAYPEIGRVVREGSPAVGEVFEPTSPESIAEAVIRVVEDPDRYLARREQARKLALERYNWRAESPRLTSIYSRLTEA